MTDHVNTANHVINCDEATIIGREPDRTTQWIREAIKIRHAGKSRRHEQRRGTYQLTALRSDISRRAEINSRKAKVGDETSLKFVSSCDCF